MNLRNLWQRIRYGRDNCSFCHGHNNGMPGNENVFYTKRGTKKLACDHCTFLLLVIDLNHPRRYESTL